MSTNYEQMMMEDGDNDKQDSNTSSIRNMFVTTSLRPFFRELWVELKELTAELIEYGKTKTWKKKLLTVVVSVASLVVFYDLLFGDIIVDSIEHFVLWMAKHSTLAVLAFVCIFVISTRKWWNGSEGCACEHALTFYFLGSHFHSTHALDFWGRLCFCSSLGFQMGRLGSCVELFDGFLFGGRHCLCSKSVHDERHDLSFFQTVSLGESGRSCFETKGLSNHAIIETLSLDSL